MFGFPEHLSDWSAHHYLRIFTFIVVYLSVRPLIQKMYTRLGERQREREKRQYEDEQIRKHKQARIREKLGIVGADGEKHDEVPEVAQVAQVASADSTASVRQRTQPAKPSKQAKSRKDEIADSMDSDEDVSDLLQ